ncbi:hypothetical protein ACP4OV_016270 [Aristida adscensionis]
MHFNGSLRVERDRGMAESAVSSVVASLGNLASQETSFLCGVHDEVGFLKEELTRLQCFLKDADDKTRAGSASATNWVRQIRDAAYQAENIIEVAGFVERRKRSNRGFIGCISRYDCLPRDLVTLHRVGVDICRVRRKIQEIASSACTLGILNLGENTVTRPCYALQNVMLESVLDEGDDIVGFKDDIEQIEGKLTNMDVKHLLVISIVATGGAGKTTLARKVYDSVAAKGHFNAFAFTSISQNFDVLCILKDIAKQAMGIEREGKRFNKMGILDELEKMGLEEIAQTLHDFLKEKRYLIALDDVWTMDTWDVMKKAFPDTENGSRVLLTTRNLQAANQADKMTYVHHLRHLNEDESWQLFCKKAFPSYEPIDMAHRLELENLGKNLVKKCYGLPLALVVLGAYLSKNLHFDMWIKMGSCLDWEITDRWEIMQRIIARSYDDMVDHHLKSCFLYTACLPEDNIIADYALIESWISEGFVPQNTRYTLEETARNYLEQLAQRSMVQVINKSNAHGWIHAIKVHDILQDWAVRKSQKEGFFIVCNVQGDLRATSSDTVTFYRTALRSTFYDGTSQPTPNMRTLFGYNLPSVTLRKLRFLRVLYLSNSDLKHCSNEMTQLIHLRYITLNNCYNVVLSSSIGRLLNLQSINFICTDLQFIPTSLWDIATLRHARFWPLKMWCPVKAEKQKELQTLSISVTNAGKIKNHVWSHTQKSLMHMTQLTSLMLSGDTNIPVGILTSVSGHHNLVKLYLGWIAGLDEFLRFGSFPPNLRTLVLHIRSPLQEDVLLALAKLRNLVRLFLAVPEYGGQSLVSPRNGFLQLQSLTLASISAEKLRFEAGTMLKLTNLTLYKCENMVRLPDGLLNLPSIRELNLEEMESTLSKESCEELERKHCKLIINDNLVQE